MVNLSAINLYGQLMTLLFFLHGDIMILKFFSEIFFEKQLSICNFYGSE